ncbi:hypothetical protein Zm00014a_003472 [Zea mays]|uniref:Uncharacterized protein n=1 Tax=Zea mays TaxID=4577 RepID=A0A3L6FLG5_MAIZE|nr:hypothetical protein Zm00014a_003472 [Zea mays]
MFCIVPFRRLYSYNNKAKITKGLIGCPHIGQPGSRYAAVVCLVVGCIHVTRRVLLCRLFGLPHMHQRLCLAMQKRSSGQALEMRPKSAHLWSQAHAMHSQGAADLARSAMLPRYGNQSGPKFFGFYHRPFKKKFYIFSNLTCGPPKPNNDMKPHAAQPVETNPEQYKRAHF